MAQARRYEGRKKLNVKRLFTVILFFIAVILFIKGIKFLLTSHSENTSGKIEALTYYTIYDNGKWGVIDSNGNTVIKSNYDEMIVIPDSTKAVFICMEDVDYKNGTYTTKAINLKEKEIVTGYDKVDAIANYDEEQNIWYESNVLKVEKDGKYGLVNFSGEELAECEYDSIEPLYGIKNSLVISKGGLYGICDNEGKIIVEPEYIEILNIEDDYKNGYIVVDENGKYGIIGADKEVVLECDYDEIKGIASNHLFVIKKNGKYEIINRDGETELANQFDDVIDINGEYITVSKNGKMGVLDLQGNTKIKFEYEDIISAGNEKYMAKASGNYGIVTIDGVEETDFIYEDMEYIPTGDIVIANYYNSEEKLISNIIDSNFEVRLTGILYDIDEAKGYMRLYCEDDYKYYNFKFEEKSGSNFLTTNTLYLSKKDGKYGFVDKSGKVVVDYIYDDATEQNSSGYAGVKIDDFWGAIDINGKVVVEPEYDLENNENIDFIGIWHLCEDKNANYYLDV